MRLVPLKDDLIEAKKERDIISLELEKKVNQSLLDLHVLAASKNDGNFSDFLEEHFLTEQVDSIKKIGDLLTRVEMAGEGLGVIYINTELTNTFDRK